MYLPGVARSALRAVEHVPPALAPIAELQYRSQWFSHPNSRDWSARALLSHPDRGLGLRISDDAETGEALLLALNRCSTRRSIGSPSSCCSTRTSSAISSTLILCGACSAGSTTRRTIASGWIDAQWTAFVQQCKSDFGFNPDSRRRDDRRPKARGAPRQVGQVWDVFASTPERYPGIPDQLRKARPQEQLALGGVTQSEVWPQDNEVAEDQLRSRLRDFEALTPEGARKEAALLDADHAWRRRTVWAELDMAPLAFALEQLVVLAELTAQPLADTDLKSLAADYAERGWRADDAALRALALAPARPRPCGRGCCRGGDVPLVARRRRQGAPGRGRPDGQRADLQAWPVRLDGEGHGRPSSSTGSVSMSRIACRTALPSIGLEVQTTTALAALPTVTETAKAVLVPVAEGSLCAGEDLWAARASSGAKATKAVLESLAVEAGVQCLSPTETGDPSGTAWTEAGQIDHLGHEPGVPLIDDIDREIDKIARRVRQLLEAGWQQVDVVTDHGWILLPGGMEKVELPVAATAKKKGRCARLKDGAAVETPTVPWFWDQDVRIAIAPGATCFEANKEYEHGGVSPQECIVPRLSVKAGSAQPTAEGPEITNIKWLGLLCRIELTGVSAGVVADLRALPGDPKTSIAEEAKETAGAGRVSLLVPDEDLEGEKAHLVLVAPDGQLLAQREVMVGRNR